MISDEYADYLLIDSEHFIVSLGELQGVIDIGNKVIVPISYDQIGYFSNQHELIGYNFSNIIVKKNDKYGIVSYKDGTLVEKLEYSLENINLLLEKLKEESVEIK